MRAYSRLIASRHTVLEIGTHTLHFARCVGSQGRVYAFEPTTSACRKLRDNTALNPSLAHTITTAQVMLVSNAASSLTPEIYSSWPLTGRHDRHVQHQGTLRSTTGAQTSTLDQFLSQADVTKIDFVELDVEGHECEVPEGWTTIKQYRPKILMELAGHEDRGRTLRELLSLISAAGYQLFRVGRQRSSRWREKVPMDAAVVAGRVAFGSSINSVAMPRAWPS